MGAQDTLATRLRGEVIVPGDPRYEAARKVNNGMIDRRPRWIARCAGVADVMACVDFARENGVLTAIRCGGHSAPGLGVCDDGLVIDLSRMKSVRVDPEARTARVEGGCTLGDVDHATHAFGLAVPAGVISTTGIGGITLGGGQGHLTRACGLTIDNLISADMVLADGRFVTASERDNPDLFWAIRGGGGNFGVVTSFEFRVHPVKDVHAGPTLWPIEQAADALRFFRDFTANAPEDINGFFAFLTVPPGPPFPAHLHNRIMCGVVWCYTGPDENATTAFREIRRFGPPAFEHIGKVPLPALQSIFDPLYPPGLQQYWRADFFTEYTAESIAEHVRRGSRLPTPLSTIHIYPVNGAAHRAGRNDMAYSYRDATWSEVIVGMDPDPAKRDLITAWTKDTWDALHPYSAGGAYVNFMGADEGQERVRATYRDNYERLAAIKGRYDPANLFRHNQNIRPAAARAA